MASLADRLKALGVRTGVAELPARRLEAPESGETDPHGTDFGRELSIEGVISGLSLATEFGETFVYEQRFAADHRQGQSPIRPAAQMQIVSAWAGDARLGELPIESFAFLDTETSGLAGGTGTYAFLVGAARFVEGGEFVLQQFFMRDPTEEPALLDALGALSGARPGAGHLQRQGVRRAAA